MTLVATFALLLAAPRLMVSLFQLSQDTTVYAAGFTEKRFRSLKRGMTAQEVIQLLGSPIVTVEEAGHIDWYYAPANFKLAANGSLPLGMPNTFLMANTEGRVVKAAGSFLPVAPKTLVGLQLSDVERRFGTPRATRVSQYTKGLFYSRSHGDGSYQRREVWIDGEGNVTAVVACYYQD